MNVLVTGPDLADSMGAGIQQHVRYLAEAFAGSETVLVVPFASTAGPYHEAWARKGLRLLGKYWTFPGAARGCDVVHVNSTVDDRSILRDIGFVALAGVIGRPVVFQFHGGRLARLKRTNSAVLRGVVSRLLRRARVTLFLSEGVAADVAQAFGLTRTELARNYVRLPDAALVRPADPSCLHVAFMGRLDAEKGVLEAIEGFSAANRGDMELRIAGAGTLTEDVARRARETAGASYLGLVDAAGRDALLAWADVYVLPTAHDEGLPYSVLEAGAAGCALVASDAGAITCIVREGVTGTVVAPRDPAAVASALTWMVAHRAECAQMGGKARALIGAEYSLPQMVAYYKALYGRAAASR